MINWRVLNFDFPEELPFQHMLRRHGAEASIYVTIVGSDMEPKEYRRNEVTRYPCNDEAKLRELWQLCRAHGDYLLWQPVQPVPNAPEKYRICLPIVCATRDKVRCALLDDMYCMKQGHCPHQRVHPEFSDERW